MGESNVQSWDDLWDLANERGMTVEAENGWVVVTFDALGIDAMFRRDGGLDDAVAWVEHHAKVVLECAEVMTALKARRPGRQKSFLQRLFGL